MTRLQSLEVDKGTTVTLSVIVAGNPAPSITWSLDDEILHEKNQRFIFERDDTENKHSLVITHITRSQEGVYRCVARNCEGSCATMGFITVKGIPGITGELNIKIRVEKLCKGGHCFSMILVVLKAEFNHPVLVFLML